MDVDDENVNLDETRVSGDGNDSEGKSTPSATPTKPKDVTSPKAQATTPGSKRSGGEGLQEYQQDHQSVSPTASHHRPSTEIKGKRRATLTRLGPVREAKQ
ncbi:hypothetical protein BIW11_02516 [Tropilaelaps mercedesae]|uniref:Uncharacterized protein n=1 Tax=Tropilaelaps mercedesae TaxID=418985 RepID=A0A1V9Y1V4_9ACAR|nr:hypothetical protein BIW11_02516 [Tropilaelaps mercedesae]